MPPEPVSATAYVPGVGYVTVEMDDTVRRAALGDALRHVSVAQTMIELAENPQVAPVPASNYGGPMYAVTLTVNVPTADDAAKAVVRLTGAFAEAIRTDPASAELRVHAWDETEEHTTVEDDEEEWDDEDDDDTTPTGQ